MMPFSEDQIALAAEYALGTLDADERAQVETTMALDPAFARMVEDWERKLSPLNQMVGLIEPRPEMWSRIKAAIGIEGAQEPVVIPPGLGEAEAAAASPLPTPSNHSGAVLAELREAASKGLATDVAAGDGRPSDAAPSAQEAAASADAPQPRREAEVIPLAAVRRWRGVALASSALAASLAAIVAAQIANPDALPQALRPKPRVEVVQAPAAPAVAPTMPGQYVAVLQRDANSPAFILTVDAAMKSFMVRRVGAQPEPGKSYELWLVSDKLQRPRSLGVIGASDFVGRSVLQAYDPEMVGRATYAVTMEPEGGSPTGVATGPVVYTGKLVETVPPGVMPATPAAPAPAPGAQK